MFIINYDRIYRPENEWSAWNGCLEMQNHSFAKADSASFDVFSDLQCEPGLTKWEIIVSPAAK